MTAALKSRLDLGFNPLFQQTPPLRPIGRRPEGNPLRDLLCPHVQEPARLDRGVLIVIA
jgi:hypothetical protein